jgi:hypothetical protein
MSSGNIKEEARRLLEKLPDDVTWDQLMHEIFVRQSIEAGLADSKAGKTVAVGKDVSDLDCRLESAVDRISS